MLCLEDLFGDKLKKNLEKLNDENIKREMVKEFVNFYGKNIVNESTLINGVKDFLIWAKKKEYIHGSVYK